MENLKFKNKRLFVIEGIEDAKNSILMVKKQISIVGDTIPASFEHLEN